MVSVTYPRIDQAVDLIDTEIEIVTDERDAFDDFLGRLADIPTDSFDAPAGHTGAAIGTLVDSSQPTTNIVAVRQAYKETVMSVPHYQTEYGESFAEHLSAEIDNTLASQIVQGTVLTGPVLDALTGAIREARTKREDFLSGLRRERESLTGIAESLSDVERRNHRLRTQIPTDCGSIAPRLHALETRCMELAKTRQETIHGRSASSWSGVDDESLLGYLYADLQTDTPALAAIGSCLASVRTHQQALHN